MWKRRRVETPCRYVEAFNEATSHLESHLESLLAKNFCELEEKRRILAQLEKSEPERVKVKERLGWLLHQEAPQDESHTPWRCLQLFWSKLSMHLQPPQLV